MYALLLCLYTLHSTKKWARHPLATGSANLRKIYTQSKGRKTQNHICQTKELHASECSCYKLDIREHFQLISTSSLILQMHSSLRLPTLFSPTPSTLNSFCLPCLSSFWNTCLNDVNHLLWSWMYSYTHPQLILCPCATQPTGAHIRIYTPLMPPA